MTLLGKDELTAAMQRKLDERLVISPLLDQAQVGSASIDVRLGTEFLLLRRTQQPGLDPAEDSQQDVEAFQERVVVPLGEKLWLHPEHFVLAATLEYVRLPNDLGAYVLGRSSWGRVGLIVATAVMVHPGFAGCLTLELVNEGDSPIALYPGLKIAQLAVHSLSHATVSPYGATDKYVAPTRPQASRLAAEQAEARSLHQLREGLASRLG